MTPCPGTSDDSVCMDACKYNSRQQACLDTSIKRLPACAHHVARNLPANDSMRLSLHSCRTQCVFHLLFESLSHASQQVNSGPLFVARPQGLPDVNRDTVWRDSRGAGGSRHEESPHSQACQRTTLWRHMQAWREGHWRWEWGWECREADACLWALPDKSC